MHAFDYVVLFFSFVYAGAIMHLLATGAEIVIAGKRVRRSWLNGGWMLVTLLATSSWWIGMWDLRGQQAWSMALIALFFVVACGFYLMSRLVSPRIEGGDEAIDLAAFHREHGRNYLAVLVVLCMVTIAVNSLLGQAAGIGQWMEQNVAVIPMLVAAVAAVIFIRIRWVLRLRRRRTGNVGLVLRGLAAAAERLRSARGRDRIARSICRLIYIMGNMR